MNDDTISRQAAIDALNAEGITKNMRAHRRILSLPSAERRGRWIMPQKYNNEYRCSVCGEMTKRDKTPFCGWCGARMDEAQVR